MKITANAKVYELSENTAVAEFIRSTGVEPSRCVVELNGRALRFEMFKDLILREGDVLEIMNVVAGG